MKIHPTVTSKSSPAASSGTRRSREKSRPKTGSQFNALTTGAYAAGRLPWESQEAFDRHHAEFADLYQPVGYPLRCLVRDIANNRWRRRRTDLMTAVAMHRDEFGQALMESGAKSWQEVKTFLHQSDVATKETFNGIVTSMVRVIEIGGEIKESHNFDEVTKLVHEMAGSCANSCERLVDIDAKLDRECKFFDQYLPERLEQITRLQNALDAQNDKMHARFQVMQEALLRREAAAVSVSFDKSADQEAAEQDSPADADNGGKESDALHREPDPGVDLDADDRDPLADFL
jgi:HPt (histidine-containing phosphotransfer) domain-containing protein